MASIKHKLRIVLSFFCLIYLTSCQTPKEEPISFPKKEQKEIEIAILMPTQGPSSIV
ncbi:MAG: penicillin-binding protein activator, partial [Rickettsia endosymbiont of Eriopis connexa]|nr:penicillin-binding protein activator [Rickettsia endosymbiont of Eriopis connexa]